MIKMENKSILRMLAILFAITMVVSGAAMYSSETTNIKNGITPSSERSSISLMPPSFIGLASATEAMGGGVSAASRSGTSFLEEEAGISAYTNVGEEINLESAKSAYRTIEYETNEYIIGSVPLPDYAETEDVHAYVHKDGWVVTYYLKEEPVAKIVDWEDYSTDERITGTKLEDGVSVVCNAAGVPIRDLKYYDFRYANADKMMIIADALWSSGTDTFDIKLPSDFVFYERSYSHYHIGSGSYVDRTSTMYIDGSEISSITVEYSNSETNYGMLSPTQLSLDTSHTVKVTLAGHGDAFDAIVLTYRDA